LRGLAALVSYWHIETGSDGKTLVIASVKADTSKSIRFPLWPEALVSWYAIDCRHTQASDGMSTKIIKPNSAATVMIKGDIKGRGRSPRCIVEQGIKRVKLRKQVEAR
jgi:hypothetical protein